MSYSLHISRVNDAGESFDDDGNNLSPISLSEWKKAIENTPGVRLASGDGVVMNPHTRETISIPNSGGDAEVYYPAKAEWMRVYSWFDGDISFKGVPSFEESADPLRTTARLLAAALDARIVGDEGEFYD